MCAGMRMRVGVQYSWFSPARHSRTREPLPAAATIADPLGVEFTAVEGVGPNALCAESLRSSISGIIGCSMTMHKIASRESVSRVSNKLEHVVNVGFCF